jgi:hypothetical protein
VFGVRDLFGEIEVIAEAVDAPYLPPRSREKCVGAFIGPSDVDGNEASAESLRGRLGRI